MGSFWHARPKPLMTSRWMLDMKEREKIIISGLTVLFIFLWLGFSVHSSSHFAGSFYGGVLAIIGSLLMFVPLLYMVVKRIPVLKRHVTEKVSMRTLLSWHIYAGVLGPILVILHTGHKFESVLGIALTGMTILVVLSGYVGRYLMTKFSSNIREQKKLLTELQLAYRQTATEIVAHPEQAIAIKPFSGFFSRFIGSLFIEHDASSIASPLRAFHLAESIADLEYALKTNEYFKSWFGIWLKFHIIISFLLYGLLILHVWAGIHFGLRWFE